MGFPLGDNAGEILRWDFWTWEAGVFVIQHSQHKPMWSVIYGLISSLHVTVWKIRSSKLSCETQAQSRVRWPSIRYWQCGVMAGPNLLWFAWIEFPHLIISLRSSEHPVHFCWKQGSPRAVPQWNGWLEWGKIHLNFSFSPFRWALHSQTILPALQRLLAKAAPMMWEGWASQGCASISSWRIPRQEREAILRRPWNKAQRSVLELVT